MEQLNLLEWDYPHVADWVATLVHKCLPDAIDSDGFTPDLREATLAYLQRKGKCLRPTLLTLAALAAGEKRPQNLVSAMMAVECYHTATLVHDDVIDHDALRRGAPTVHTLVARRAAERLGRRLDAARAGDYGVATAIVAGDVLFGQSAALFALLSSRYPSTVVNSILWHQAGELNPGLLAGEQLDMELELAELEEVTPKQVETMMRLKTGLLLSFAARVGAALGARKPIENAPLAEPLGAAAEAAGIAFQIQDDILGLFGDERQLGKPIGSDLREGKRTLLMVKAWSKATAKERKFLMKVLGNQELSMDDLAAARAIVERTGALAACRRRANALLKHAEHSCQAVPDAAARNLLLEWIHTLVKRNR